MIAEGTANKKPNASPPRKWDARKNPSTYRKELIAASKTCLRATCFCIIVS
jgi:hypothetical protein